MAPAVFLMKTCKEMIVGPINPSLYYYSNPTPAEYFDYSRDLLCMINQFRDQMPRPLIGVAHSMGAIQMLNIHFLLCFLS